MITDEQIQEIRNYLEKSENPLFFFDDDPDGLTSFLLLKKRYQKGKGVCVKVSPIVEDIYLRKIKEHSPDLIVLLDRPLISQELIDNINVPFVWIDHHTPVERKGVHYYNPMVPNGDNNKPTSYWCYKVAAQEENMWIALVGIVGDWQVPEFISEFPFQELLGGKKTPPEILFQSEFGKLIKIFAFMLKGQTSEVGECIKILEKIESPMEILEQKTAKAKYLYKKFMKMNKDYESLLKKALEQKTKDNVYFFLYPSSKTSFTSMLSNELLFTLPNKVVMVGREKDGWMKMSIRGNDFPVLPVLKKVLPQIHGYGGGHAMACGAGIKKEDFDQFIELFKKEVSASSK